MRQEPGTYALVLRCDDRCEVRIGRWGILEIVPGYLIYVGSAFGPGGVRARVLRHLRGGKRRHWHIDYLAAAARTLEVWYSHDPVRLEHRWARTLRNMPDVGAVRGFGCSDCDCYAHLFVLQHAPDIDQFGSATGQRVECWRPTEPGGR